LAFSFDSSLIADWDEAMDGRLKRQGSPIVCDGVGFIKVTILKRKILRAVERAA